MLKWKYNCVDCYLLCIQGYSATLCHLYGLHNKKCEYKGTWWLQGNLCYYLCQLSHSCITNCDWIHSETLYRHTHCSIWFSHLCGSYAFSGHDFCPKGQSLYIIISPTLRIYLYCECSLIWVDFRHHAVHYYSLYYYRSQWKTLIGRMTGTTNFYHSNNYS